MILKQLQKELRKYASKEKAAILQRFFKTGPGEYGEGDIFIGVKVPEIRSVAKKYCELNINDVKKLLKSSVHEERLLALLVLISQYSKTESKEKIFNLYLKSTKYINNWDLVDLSAPNIVGEHLLTRNRRILFDLAESGSLWERRIAIIATLRFIRNYDFKDTCKIAEILLTDNEDLIHKAVGWMLREVGKRDLEKEEMFLVSTYKKMPRTMLRYAIERFPEKKRQAYLAGKI